MEDAALKECRAFVVRRRPLNWAQAESFEGWRVAAQAESQLRGQLSAAVEE